MFLMYTQLMQDDGISYFKKNSFGNQNSRAKIDKNVIEKSNLLSRPRFYILSSIEVLQSLLFHKFLHLTNDICW